MHWITIAETEIMAQAENPKHQSLNQKLLLHILLLNRLAKLPMNVSAAGAGDEGSGG
jgi:hypothetical protein